MGPVYVLSDFNPFRGCIKRSASCLHSRCRVGHLGGLLLYTCSPDYLCIYHQIRPRMIYLQCLADANQFTSLDGIGHPWHPTGTGAFAFDQGSRASKRPSIPGMECLLCPFGASRCRVDAIWVLRDAMRLSVEDGVTACQWPQPPLEEPYSACYPPCHRCGWPWLPACSQNFWICH